MKDFEYLIINGNAVITGYVGNETNVEIPSTIEVNGDTYSVTIIGYGAFYNCSSLTSVVIPNSIDTIGYSAFEGCSSLTSIVIPNSVTSIGNDVFSECSSLKYNEYDNGLYLGNEDNPYLVLVKAKDRSITSCVINENTRFIHSWSFYGCSSLTSVVIPNSVTTIGDFAFYGCSQLTIYCEVSSKLSGWNRYWNYSKCPVVWEAKR